MTLRDLTILVIDENAIRASIIEEGLREAGYQHVNVIHEVNGVARTIETLQNSGAVKSVSSSMDRVDGDYMLSMEIRAFQIDNVSGRPAADVDIFAKLIDNNSSKVVATKGFSTRVASANDTPQASVAALNQALTEVLQDTSSWVATRR